MNSLVALAGVLAVLAFCALIWGWLLARGLFRTTRDFRPLPGEELLMDSTAGHWTLLMGHHATAPASFALVFGAAALVTLGWLAACIVVIITAVVFDITQGSAGIVAVRDGEFYGIAGIVRSGFGRRFAVPFALLGIGVTGLLVATSVYVASELMSAFPPLVPHAIIFVLVAIACGIVVAGSPPLAAHIFVTVLAVVTLALALGSEPWQLIPRYSFTFEANPTILTLIVSGPLVLFCLVASVLPVQFAMRPLGHLAFILTLMILGVLMVGLGIYPGRLPDPYTLHMPAVGYRFFFGLAGGGALIGLASLTTANVTARQVRDVDDVVPLSVTAGVFKAACALAVITIAASVIGASDQSPLEAPTVLARIKQFHGNAQALFGRVSVSLSVPALRARWIAPYALLVLSLAALPALLRVQTALFQEMGDITGLRWLRLRRVAAVLTALMTFVTCYALTVSTASDFVVRHGFTTWRSIVNVAATHVPSYGVMWVWPLFGAAAFLLCAGACMALAASQRKVRQSWRLLVVLGSVCLAGGAWAAGHEVLTADPVGDVRLRVGALVLAVMCVWLAIESIVVFIGRRPPVAGPDTILQASRNAEEQS